MTTPRRLAMTVCSLLWVALTVGAILLSARRDAAPGDPGDPATDWPVTSSLRPLAGGGTLVMQAHAQCPCTLASLDELERLLRDLDGRPVRAYVLVVAPAGAEVGFAAGEALERARALQATGVVAVVVDTDGREAARFGARTRGVTEMRAIAGQRAELERANEEVEGRVRARTAQLQVSEQRFRQLSSELPTGVFLPDPAGRLEYGNPENDTALMARAAHELKGSAGSCGAVAIASAASRLEALGSADQTQEAWDALELIERDVARTMPVLLSLQVAAA